MIKLDILFGASSLKQKNSKNKTHTHTHTTYTVTLGGKGLRYSGNVKYDKEQSR